MWQQDYVYPGAMAYKSYGDLAGSAIRGAGDNIKRDKDTALASALKQQEGMNKLEWEAQKLYSELEPDYMFKNLRQETYEVPQVILDRRTNREKYMMDQAELAQKTANDAAELAQRERQAKRDYALGKKGLDLQGRGMKQYEQEREDKLKFFSNPHNLRTVLSTTYGNDPKIIQGVANILGRGNTNNADFQDYLFGRATPRDPLAGNLTISREQAESLSRLLDTRIKGSGGGGGGIQIPGISSFGIK